MLTRPAEAHGYSCRCLWCEILWLSGAVITIGDGCRDRLERLLRVIRSRAGLIVCNAAERRMWLWEIWKADCVVLTERMDRVYWLGITGMHIECPLLSRVLNRESRTILQVCWKNSHDLTSSYVDIISSYHIVCNFAVWWHLKPWNWHQPAPGNM